MYAIRSYYVSKMNSLALASNASKAGSKVSINILEDAIKTTLMQEKFTAEETTLIDNPINLVETTVVGDQSAEISVV